MSNKSDFPRDADAFKEWADRECPKWPSRLMAAAQGVFWAMRDHPAYPKSLIDDFASDYKSHIDYRTAHVLSGSSA